MPDDKNNNRGRFIPVGHPRDRRVQILTIADLLDGKARAEHPNYEPDLNFKKAKAESGDEQATLL